MPEQSQYTWCNLPEELDEVPVDGYISYEFYVSRQTQNETGQTTQYAVTNLKLEVIEEEILNEEGEVIQKFYPMPKSLEVLFNEDKSILTIQGNIDIDPAFEELAYSGSGVEYYVDTVEEIPKGAKAFKMIPDEDEYKYLKWRIYANDSQNGKFLVEKTYIQQIRMSYDKVKAIIKRVASEIV